MAIDHLVLREDVKMCIDVAVKSFMQTSPENEFEFPSSLTKEERAYIHKVCALLGIKSRSSRDGQNKLITLYKEPLTVSIHRVPELKLSRTTLQIALTFLQNLSSLNENFFRNQMNSLQNQISNFDITKNSRNGKIGQVIPQIPPISNCDDSMAEFRCNLPVYQYRNEIINTINNNSIVLITGSTGCGKTTQIPQYILEHYQSINKPCSIIVAEPRRIAAVTMANRISFERGEQIGQTVGFQIRLESKLSPKTLLTFCTNGVLVRTLISSKSVLDNISHIIIDEVHERDFQTDLLILFFKQMKQEFPHIKFILMSASLDIKKLSAYLFNCPVIEVPGRAFEVKQYFLEDILEMTNFMTQNMNYFKNYLLGTENEKKVANKWAADLKRQIEELKNYLTINNNAQITNRSSYKTNSDEDEQLEFCEDLNRVDVLDNIKQEADSVLKNAMLTGEYKYFSELTKFITKKRIPVDYKNSETGITALIAAVCHNKMYLVERFLYLGANILTQAANGFNALNWAQEFDYKEIVDLLNAYLEFEKRTNYISKFNEENDKAFLCNPNSTLDLYLMAFDQCSVDIKLIYEVIIYIFKMWPVHKHKASTILIFLPGYNEIMDLRDYIDARTSNCQDSESFIVYTIHSQINTTDQKKMFERPPKNVRKIILSTNISETSITIDDVGFVIDSGKVKETLYDSNNDFSMLNTFWASKSSVLQRKGRAGRCQSGVCFHLYTRARFNKMEEFQSPIIQRMPMYEICLQSKLLLQNNSSITVENFLQSALDPPNPLNISVSIDKLKMMDALNPDSSLSELGVHLLDLPLEPCLGKMVLFSVILRCLDPVLTIACTLAHKDPFGIVDKRERVKQIKSKIDLCKDSYSDHMILLRVYQEWQRAQKDNNHFEFARMNGIEMATMDMIVAMRSKVLGQLRASGFVRTRQPNDIKELNQNSENWAVVKAALCAGQYPNILNKDSEFKGEQSKQKIEIKFHPSSIFQLLKIKTLPTKWLMYHQKIKINHKAYLQYCTVVSPLTIVLFAGSTKRSANDLYFDSSNGLFEDSDSENEDKRNELHALKLDENIKFHMTKDLANTIVKLRQQFNLIFQKRMLQPNRLPSPDEESTIHTIVNMLTAEDKALNLRQPEGVGQRPKQMNQSFEPVILNYNLGKIQQTDLI